MKASANEQFRETGRYVEVRYIVPAGYVAALIWYLIRSGPSLNQLPELQPLLFPRRRYGAWIPVLGIALLLALTAGAEPQDDELRFVVLGHIRGSFNGEPQRNARVVAAPLVRSMSSRNAAAVNSCSPPAIGMGDCRASRA